MISFFSEVTKCIRARGRRERTMATEQERDVQCSENGNDKTDSGVKTDPVVLEESSLVFICFLDVLWDYGELCIHGFPFVFQNLTSK